MSADRAIGPVTLYAFHGFDTRNHTHAHPRAAPTHAHAFTRGPPRVVATSDSHLVAKRNLRRVFVFFAYRGPVPLIYIRSSWRASRCSYGNKICRSTGRGSWRRGWTTWRSYGAVSYAVRCKLSLSRGLKAPRFQKVHLDEKRNT